MAGVRYWGYRRFTRAGLMVSAGFFVAGVMAPDTDNNVAYQSFTFLLLLLLLARPPRAEAVRPSRLSMTQRKPMYERFWSSYPESLCPQSCTSDFESKSSQMSRRGPSA